LALPEVNVQYGVKYLARAWRLAGGDLCRALMKYRAGHGEVRMTALSAEYCRRARAHLALVGAPEAIGYGPVELGTPKPPLTQAVARVSRPATRVASPPAALRKPKLAMSQPSQSSAPTVVRGGRSMTNLYFAQARAQSAQAHARVSAMHNAKELLAAHRARPLRSS